MKLNEINNCSDKENNNKRHLWPSQDGYKPLLPTGLSQETYTSCSPNSCDTNKSPRTPVTFIIESSTLNRVISFGSLLRGRSKGDLFTMSLWRDPLSTWIMLHEACRKERGEHEPIQSTSQVITSPGKNATERAASFFVFVCIWTQDSEQGSHGTSAPASTASVESSRPFWPLSSAHIRPASIAVV